MALANPTSVRAKDSVGWTPLHLACSDSESAAFSSRQVWERNLDVRILHPGSVRCFPWRRNCSAAALAMCQVLIEAGADVNAPTTENFPWTPMHNVASSGWVTVAELLLQNGGRAFSPKTCSPYCWSEDRYDAWLRAGEGPGEMRNLLRAYISDEQWIQIKELHKAFSKEKSS